MRKTKIVCTLGPATDREGVLRDMICAGMNVARFNFSHGTHEDHARRLAQLQKLRDELDMPVAALLDTNTPARFQKRQGAAEGRADVHPHHPRSDGR